MSQIIDGPVSPYFKPLLFQGNVARVDLPTAGISPEMVSALPHLPSGECICWGIPFTINDRMILLQDQPVHIEISPTKARWFIFMHTSDLRPLAWNSSGFVSPMKGEGQLGEHAADYVMCYADGSEARVEICRRRQVGPFTRGWGANCFEAVPQRKQKPVRASHEQLRPNWGSSQTRVDNPDHDAWQNWLWAWENPHPEVPVIGFRCEPGEGVVVLSAISTGEVSSLPLRWQPRAKACLTLPAGKAFQPDLDEAGLLKQIQLDLGQVISATPRLVYPNDAWTDGYHNQLPVLASSEILLEYTAHPDACFHLPDGKVISVAQVEADTSVGPLHPVKPAQQAVKLRVTAHGSGKIVPVKLHVHGEWGEYLAPLDRHRIINPAWYEDYSVDFLHVNWGAPAIIHSCTYINGETTLKLPLGKVFIEVSKGFEIQPVRRVVEVTPATTVINIEIDKVLPWREQGWVTADTHVHFLSPISALLEGSAEGVNVVNLLASQWGELMTNVGDFDGKTTWGAVDAGGDGEYLVRVGTENRQHVLGHISLLGYNGGIIAPMTTGGPDESALGDPIEVLLTEWARQCRQQGGVVVLPHFPNPRAEHAASIVSGEIDALEMTAWSDHYSGISPYSLSDWYRYLNCGYLVPAVGGTDKMSASTAVGTVRTYARVAPNQPFTYDTWMDAIRRAETFVTYGPLLEFSVDGRPMGSRIEMSASGGTVEVSWHVSSVTIPMTRVELIVNGEIRASSDIAGNGAVSSTIALSQSQDASGHWSFRVDKSAWLALLVRGHQPGKPEMIAAHSTPVMVQVAGSPMLAAADALTILEQIEGALAYLDTVGTRAEDRIYRRMRLVLEASHRTLHNRMHLAGRFHAHTVPEDHPEHH